MVKFETVKLQLRYLQSHPAHKLHQYVIFHDSVIHLKLSLEVLLYLSKIPNELPMANFGILADPVDPFKYFIYILIYESRSFFHLYFKVSPLNRNKVDIGIKKKKQKLKIV